MALPALAMSGNMTKKEEKAEMLGKVVCVMVTLIKICSSKEGFKVVSGSKIRFSEIKEEKKKCGICKSSKNKMQGTRFT